MLRELKISNLAVIEDANIELKPGLNIFTGQTGAGKSLIIGAFELLLGLRSGGAVTGSMIRTGAEEARVTGLFELPDQQTANEIGNILDRDLDHLEPLLIIRRIFTSGRSSVSINGEPTTAALLKKIGQFLVDIHGQHDQQYLLKPSNQLKIIDAFSKALGLRSKFAEIFAQHRDLTIRRQELTESQSERNQKLELLKFQANEIDQAEPIAGEFAELQARYQKLSNIGKLKSDAAQIQAYLYESEGAIIDQLSRVQHQIADIAKLDEENVDPIAQQVSEAAELLQDSAYQLTRYADSLEIEPGELEETEARLDSLNNLIHKYAGPAKSHKDPLAVVLAFRDKIGQQISDLELESADLSDLDAKIDSLYDQLVSIGRELSQARHKSADKLKPLVEKQLKQLGMKDATFEVRVESPDFNQPIQASSATGFDTLEFMVATNPGQASQPLRKVASGGETSRIMLALKSILAESDQVSVLVFDEIDSNIGGRLGTVIGKKMRQLAHRIVPGKKAKKTPASIRHQVLCITHLPQIAAFADNHLHIAKNVTKKGSSKATHTTVNALTGDDRLNELAEMMVGKNISETAIAQARELVELAEL